MGKVVQMPEKAFYVYECPPHFIHSHKVKRTANDVTIASVGGAALANFICDAVNAHIQKVSPSEQAHFARQETLEGEFQA